MLHLTISSAIVHFQASTAHRHFLPLTREPLAVGTLGGSSFVIFAPQQVGQQVSFVVLLVPQVIQELIYQRIGHELIKHLVRLLLRELARYLLNLALHFLLQDNNLVWRKFGQWKRSSTCPPPPPLTEINRDFSTSHCFGGAKKGKNPKLVPMIRVSSTIVQSRALFSKPSRNRYLSSSSSVSKALPGLALALGTSQVGFALAHELGMSLLHFQGLETTATTQSPISGIPVSILLGLLVNNAVIQRYPQVSARLDSGLKAATKPVLQTGIVCVGAKLSVVDLFTTGLLGIPCVGASVLAGMKFIPWYGKQLGLSDKMSSLIAGGTSICGITAITAIAPAIRANEKDASFAIANVVAFGTLGMLTMPYVAHSLLQTSFQAGLFLGLSVHDTSQVIGSALTYSSVYGDDQVLKTAAVTKLTRNLMLAGVVPYLEIGRAHV